MKLRNIIIFGLAVAVVFVVTIILVPKLSSRQNPKALQKSSAKYNIFADTGATSPGTAANDASVGSVSWEEVNNIKTSDNQYSYNIGHDNEVSNYLKATNFGFAIPVGSTIDGIVVSIERYRSSATELYDSAVRIVKADGSFGGENKASVDNWPAVDTAKTYGGVADIWSEVWTAEDINDSDFGVVLSVIHPDFAPEPTSEARVDHITITVYYTEGGDDDVGPDDDDDDVVPDDDSDDSTPSDDSDDSDDSVSDDSTTTEEEEELEAEREAEIEAEREAAAEAAEIAVTGPAEIGIISILLISGYFIVRKLIVSQKSRL